MRRRMNVVAFCIVAIWCNSCGQGDARRYHVSGTVTYKDAPLYGGRIDFNPDTSKGNVGPQGTALIQDGKYDTRGVGGIATVGGPVIVEIMGFDRPNVIGCRYKFELDLPKNATVQDIKIPKSAEVTPTLVNPAAGGF